ncbi:flagellar biosynthetic protein FliO [Rhodanobacter sp. PCA2]|uniref:FliO/MopB family protein n=1 Tax=Rhodanobacter sp. PCA2 TaxID=2006117 RepID=UPI0015E7235A|nr:flagellar biosynthetic protein FliO [Rhodanobacter sp. PCA2]MBA2077203.1 flagellar biosynthesis protein FliO [Rhodanobacter sp. PCA2]
MDRTSGTGCRVVAALALPAADIDVGSELLRVLLSVAAVVAMIFVAGWLSRRMQARRGPGGRRLRCVEAIAVGARDRVLLLDADGKRLLVGVGPAGLRTLHVYEGAAPAEPASPTPLPAVPSIVQLLSRWKARP